MILAVAPILGEVNDHRLVSAVWLADAVSQMFEAAGLPRDAARTAATSLVEADQRGTSSHGAMLVPMYVERLRKGSVSTAVQAEVLLDAGAIAVLDAHHCLGQLSGDQAMAMAVDKAAVHGVGVVTVRHAFHFGAAFRYVRAAAAAGCIGVAAANTRPLMPASGGAVPVVGNNPIAIAVPGKGEPIVLDMALSEASLGKIRLAEQDDRPIPATWATDRDGVPTTNPADALSGMLQPAAGHKGFGLALMIDVLAGVLSGGSFGSDVKGLYADTAVPNDCSHFFLALSISAFGDPGDFAKRLADLTGQVTGSPRAPGGGRPLLPGQLEAERAAAATDVTVSASVLNGLYETAASLGVELREPS